MSEFAKKKKLNYLKHEEESIGTKATRASADEIIRPIFGKVNTEDDMK